MRVETEGDTETLHFRAPATLEVDRDLLDYSNRPEIRTIRLEMRGVKLISSMVLGALMGLVDRHQKDRRIVLCHLEPELRNLFHRTGLGSWLSMIEDSRS